MSENRKTNLDPLYQLFEHYLFNRSYDDASAFTKEIAEEYLTYLDSTPAHVPFHTRVALLKDLESEAHEMLIKRMYGCVQATDYQNRGNVLTVGKDELKTHEFSPQQKRDEALSKDE